MNKSSGQQFGSSNKVADDVNDTTSTNPNTNEGMQYFGSSNKVADDVNDTTSSKPNTKEGKQ